MFAQFLFQVSVKLLSQSTHSSSALCLDYTLYCLHFFLSWLPVLLLTQLPLIPTGTGFLVIMFQNASAALFTAVAFSVGTGSAVGIPCAVKLSVQCNNVIST